MDEKQAYAQKLQAQLDEWNAEIDKLRAKAAKAEAEAEIHYAKQIQELEQQQQEAKARLRELEQSSTEAWRDLKVGLDSAWQRLGESVRAASSRFK